MNMLNELIGSVAQVFLFSLIPFLVWLVTARGKESFFSWIGLKKAVCSRPGKVIGITAAAAATYILAMNLFLRLLPEGVTTAGSQFEGQGFAALPAVLFYAFLRTALSEEILFRGFLLKRLRNRFGFAAGNTVQAILFGLMHGIPFGLVTKSAAVFLLLTAISGLFGWYQGWLNESQCGGSVIPSWLLHGCMNFLTAVLSL